MPTSASILLVDDEPSNFFVLQGLLQAQGYQTVCAASGAQAVAIAQTTALDLIVLDVVMPDMDGFAVYHRLRADATLPLVPIIFLTTLDADHARLKQIALQGDDTFSKPIDAQRLVSKIANSLRLHQVRTQQVQLQSRQAQQQLAIAQQLPQLRAQKAQSQAYRQLRHQEAQQLATTQHYNQQLLEKLRVFVPEQYLTRIARQGIGSIQLGYGREEQLTVLFCDIRGFTTLSESRQASETFQWLNAFFTRMNQVITTHYGFIDKYIGDACLTIFDRAQHHAQDAVSAAVMMRRALIQFNQNRTLFNLEDPVNVGIGLHSGQVMIGTIGSEDRMDSTVIGDAVNTATRLEELTKLYGCQIIASDAVIAQLNQPDQFYVRCIDRVALRGKRQVNEIYEVLGTSTYLAEGFKVLSRSLLSQGLQAWQAGEFEVALAHFKQVFQRNSLDTIAALYIQRCQEKLGLVPEHSQTVEQPWDGTSYFR
ncbi:MAG TPA: adenylate/guanylate cyclase domain-containing protein [Candidatus Caenarcaniphilales bacterium]